MPTTEKPEPPPNPPTPCLPAADPPHADWNEIERIAKLPFDPMPCVHNSLVNICRALVEMTAR